MKTMLQYSARTLLPLLIAALSGCAVVPENDIYTLHRQAQVAYLNEDDARAEKLLLGLARATPNDPETWFYLGNLYARTNRPEQATQAYQKSLMLNRGDARVWHNLGVVRVRESWAAFIQAHALAPSGEPLRAKLEALIEAMENIPLESMSSADEAPVSVPAAAK